MSSGWDFRGKRVLVTGGSQGIGFAIAAAFNAAGGEVHITGTRSLAQDYDADLSNYIYHSVNLSDASARKQLIENCGSMDILINNAGMSGDNEYDYEGYLQTLEVNLNACVDLCYAFKQQLAGRDGVIVNVGSSASFIALRKQPAYTASKAGLLGFTRAIADEWIKQGVRVNLVAPGFVDTRIIDWVKEGERGKAIVKTIPAGRFANTHEIAQPVLFLASPAASYIVGQSLIVDGGLMLR